MQYESVLLKEVKTRKAYGFEPRDPHMVDIDEVVTIVQAGYGNTGVRIVQGIDGTGKALLAAACGRCGSTKHLTYNDRRLVRIWDCLSCGTEYENGIWTSVYYLTEGGLPIWVAGWLGYSEPEVVVEVDGLK